MSAQIKHQKTASTGNYHMLEVPSKLYKRPQTATSYNGQDYQTEPLLPGAVMHLRQSSTLKPEEMKILSPVVIFKEIKKKHKELAHKSAWKVEKRNEIRDNVDKKFSTVYIAKRKVCLTQRKSKDHSPNPFQEEKKKAMI